MYVVIPFHQNCTDERGFLHVTGKSESVELSGGRREESVMTDMKKNIKWTAVLSMVLVLMFATNVFGAEQTEEYVPAVYATFWALVPPVVAIGDKVLMLEADSRFGKFEFRPLEPGFGITVGNALRRILLSSLEGFAINTIKIEGVEHEFASVPGVKEDVTNIILNLKQVRFKQVVEEFENEKVSITVENSSEFKAGDISKYLTGFEVLNPELVICHLDSKATMQMDITINKGRGYVPADENREYCTDVNVIPIDSIYTPIRNVKYQVENFRVEQKTDYEKLVLEITTDGSIHPKEALKEAAKILIYHFMLFSDEKITLETSDVDGNEEFDEEVLHMRQLLKTKLVDMDLSVRALNCLKAADVETLGDLVQFNKTDLLKFRNFGKKSLTELDDLLEGLNLSFGTDISKYKLDKE